MASVRFVDETGVTRLAGELVPPPAGGGYVTGSGSPVGVVTPTAGSPVYIDVDAGTLYAANGATNLDWVALGPVAGNIGEAAGLVFDVPQAWLLAGDRDDAAVQRQAYFGDTFSFWNGHSQGLYWQAGPGEGLERLHCVTGATGQHDGVLQDEDGNLSPAGTVIDLPDPTNPQDAATKAYVDSELGGFIPQGGPLTGTLDAGNQFVTDLDYVAELIRVRTVAVGNARYFVAGDVGAGSIVFLLGAPIAETPDGELAAGELGAWFDDTNGASSFELKGKSADGTVVSASIPMAHVDVLGHIGALDDGAMLRYDAATRSLEPIVKPAINLASITLLADLVNALDTLGLVDAS